MQILLPLAPREMCVPSLSAKHDWDAPGSPLMLLEVQQGFKPTLCSLALLLSALLEQDLSVPGEYFCPLPSKSGSKNHFKCNFQGEVLKDQDQIHQKRSGCLQEAAGTAPPEQLKSTFCAALGAIPWIFPLPGAAQEPPAPVLDSRLEGQR